MAAAMYGMATIALLHCICNLSILRITNSFRTTLTMPPPRIIQHKKKPKFDAHHMKKMSSSSDYYDDDVPSSSSFVVDGNDIDDAI